MFQAKAKIIYNKRVNHKYLYLLIREPRIAKEASAGQFLNIKVSDNVEPFLRRPFSIHRVNGVNIEVLYEVIGLATQILSQKKAGEYLDIIGPLGNGFDYEGRRTPACRTGRKDEERILVAGGMGIAPLMFLAGKLKKTKAIVLIGAKTKNDILCEKEFKKLGCDVKIATDDGSRGFKGKVTDLLKRLLSTMDYRLWTIYGCGPRPMLKEISRLSKECNIPAQISLEEHLACGIGACLGCVVGTIDGYKRVCREGPVFKADEIIWSNEGTTYGMPACRQEMT